MPSPVEFSKALADPIRWRIIRLVMLEPLCVCELADILEMPQSSVSSHVQIIRKADLLESEKVEKWTYFRIHSNHLKLIRSIAALSSEDDVQLPEDTGRMDARLSQRLGSCCPGPQRLKGRVRNPSSTGTR